MKKFTILFSLLFSFTLIFAQGPAPIKAQNPSYFLDRNLGSHFTTKWENKTIYKRVPTTRGAIVSSPLGTAANAYTTLTPESNDVAADNNLNTVVFIHRNDNTKFENVISHYRYDVSKDGGLSWTNNVGPLNPNNKDSAGWYNGRFPQVTIYNKLGNSNPDSAYIGYLGSWHEGGSATSNAIWNGIITGVAKLDGSSSTFTEHDLTTNNGNTLIAAALCQGLPGEFWAVDKEQSGVANDSVVIVYKGVWNNTTRDIDWIGTNGVYARLNPHYRVNGTTTASLTPVIAFDPSGMNGWIGSSADFGGNSAGTYTPYFFNTTDGGVTWNGPYVLDMTTIHCIMNRVGDGNIPLAGFDLDMVVDKNGNPHLTSTVGLSDLNYAIVPPFSVYDFSYTVSGNTWNVNRLDTIYTFRGQIGNGSEENYDQDNRPQASTTADGSKVMFIWSDSPSNAGGDNSVPDLFGQGLDVNSGKWTNTVNFTGSDNIWGGSTTFPSVSPNSLSNGGTNSVPVVITKLDPTLDPTLPASFFYFSNINFDDDSYSNDKVACASEGVNQVKKSDLNITVFPNPANEIMVINGPAELHNSVVNVYNVLGQLVFSDKMKNNTSYTLNTKSLTGGIYTLTIVNGNSVSSKQFVVSH